MNCDKTEKISEMIDGELPPNEVKELTQHIENCALCESARNDFMFFREQIKSLAEVSASGELQNTRQSFLRRLLKKRLEISFPVPVFTLSLLIVSLLGVWGWVAFRKGAQQMSSTGSTKQIQKDNSPNSPDMVETSLARFDGGGRAEIYTIKNRSVDNNAKQPGEVK